MTEQEVNQIIAKDYENLHKQLFPDELPPWLLDGFADAIYETPQADHNFFARTVQSILDKGNNTDKLTLYEAGFVLNLWTHLPPKVFGVDLKTFLERKAIIEPIVQGYNHLMKKEERKIELKKETFMRNIRKTAIIH